MAKVTFSSIFRSTSTTTVGTSGATASPSNVSVAISEDTGSGAGSASASPKSTATSWFTVKVSASPFDLRSIPVGPTLAQHAASMRALKERIAGPAAAIKAALDASRSADTPAPR